MQLLFLVISLKLFVIFLNIKSTKSTRMKRDKTNYRDIKQRERKREGPTKETAIDQRRTIE